MRTDGRDENGWIGYRMATVSETPSDLLDLRFAAQRVVDAFDAVNGWHDVAYETVADALYSVMAVLARQSAPATEPMSAQLRSALANIRTRSYSNGQVHIASDYFDDLLEVATRLAVEDAARQSAPATEDDLPAYADDEYNGRIPW